MRATERLSRLPRAVLCLALVLLAPAVVQASSHGSDLGLDREQALSTSQAALGREIADHALLDREGRVASRYPGAEDKVLLLQLEHGRVTAKQEVADAQALREALAEVKAR